MSILNRPVVDLSTLKPDEMKALEEMRKVFKDEDYPDKQDASSWFQLEDWTFLRYLRARNFNLTKAAEMLRGTIKFRSLWKPHLLSADDEAIKSMIERGYWQLPGCNKEGYPIMIIPYGRYDYREIATFEEDFTRAYICQNEMLMRQLVANGWKADKTIWVGDLSEYSLLKHGNTAGMRIGKLVVAINEAHYPEFMEKAILYKSPVLFQALWMAVRPLFAEATRDKIGFSSSPDALPVAMGERETSESFEKISLE